MGDALSGPMEVTAMEIIVVATMLVLVVLFAKRGLFGLVVGETRDG